MWDIVIGILFVLNKEDYWTRIFASVSILFDENYFWLPLTNAVDYIFDFPNTRIFK